MARTSPARREALGRYAYALPAALWAGVLLATALARDLGPLEDVQVVAHQDLAGHLVEYVVLGALVALALLRTTGYTPLEAFLVTVFVSAAYGLLLEGLQAFVPGRTASTADAVMNTLGALIGGAISIYVISRHKG